MTRKIADCREMPSESHCTLTIAGEEDEVLRAATDHAVAAHGHKRSPELSEEIRTMLTDEEGAAREASRPLKKSMQQPDEQRPFAGHGRLDVVELGGGRTVGRAMFEPGWKWSNDVKPIAGTESCEASHLGYVVRGRLMIRMNDGTELLVQAGEAFQVPPGHDAWVVGEEAAEVLDFGGFAEYAKAPEERPREPRERPGEQPRA
jgi:hypothetical protein